MDLVRILQLGLLPLAIAASFLVHWLSVSRLRTAEARLPYCRGAYLAFSLQLLIFAGYLWSQAQASHAGPGLIALGMAFSFAGDYFNLRFPAAAARLGEPVFYGILSFAIAQICYLGAFLSFAPLERLLTAGWLIPLALALTIAPALIFRLRVYNPARPKRIMYAAFLYGLLLGVVVAVALSAALAEGGYWLLVAGGMLFFLLSDAVMGETTIHGRHPPFEFQIPWFTYLIAQGLILTGTGRLAGV